MPDELDPLSEIVSSRADANREALKNPRVRQFLDKISVSEGADYNTLVGGRKIRDLSRHPNTVGLTTKAGPSTAFGRYQITGTTNRTKLRKYADLDYSPENQDVRAVELLRQTRALDALEQGDEQTAMKRAGREWASIPGSPLPGRKNTRAFHSQPERDPLSEIVSSRKSEVLSSSSVDDELDPLSEIVATRKVAPPLQTAAPRNAERVRAQRPVGRFAGLEAGAGPVVADTGMGALHRLDDPEASRINRIQQQVTAQQSEAERNLRLRPGARLMDAAPTENEEVLRRLAEGQGQPGPSESELAAREAEAVARRGRVAQMGTGEYLAQAPKSVATGFAGGVGTSLKGMAALNQKLGILGPILGPLGLIDTIAGEGEKTTDRATYQLGEAIAKGSAEILRSNPDLEQEFFVGKAPATLGQVAQFMLGGAVTKSPKLAVAILGGALTAGDAYDEVRARGGSDEEAVNAGLLAGAILGPTELIGMRGALKALSGTTREATLRAAMKTALREGKRDAIENALQEVGQEFGQGVITKNPRTAGQLAEAGALGAIGGTATVPLTLAGTVVRPMKLREEVDARQAETQRQGVQAEQPAVTAENARGTAIPVELPGTQATVSEALPQRFYHKDWGEVEVAADQSGARPGKVKVLDVGGVVHYPQKSDLRGVGNSRMVPVKVPVEVTPETAAIKPAEILPAEGVPLAPSMPQNKNLVNEAAEPVSPRSEIKATPPGEVASVPFMITRRMEASLKERGYSQGDIDKLTPQQAHDILASPAQEATSDVLADPNLGIRARNLPDSESESSGRENLIESTTEPVEKPKSTIDSSKGAAPPAPLTEPLPPIREGENAEVKAARERIQKLVKEEVKPPSPASETRPERPPLTREDFEPVSPKDIKVGDHVRQRANKQTAGITGEIVSVGRVNVKIKTQYQPAPDGPIYDQVHTLRREDIDDAFRLKRQAGSDVLTVPSRSPRARNKPESSVPKIIANARERLATDKAFKESGGKKMGSGGPDTQLLIDHMIVHGWDAYQSGKAKFEDWATEMKRRFGEDIEPHLRSVWATVTGKEASEPEAAKSRPSTSVKNAATEELRADLGLLEIEGPERKSFQRSIDNALAKGLDKKAESIADDVISGKKPDGINDEEAAGIQHRMRELENRYEELHAKDKSNPELVQIEATLDRLTEATKKGGTAVARSLSFRRSAIDKDFKLISLIQRAKTAKGRELNEQERARYEGIVKERDKAIADRDAALEQLHAKEVQKALDEVSRTRSRVVKKEALDKEAKMYRDNIVAEFMRIKAQMSGIHSMGGLGNLDPEGVITKNLLLYARNRAQANIGLKAESLLDDAHALVEQFGVTRRQVAEALTGYGLKSVDRRSEAAKKLEAIRDEITALLKEQDIEAGRRSPRSEGPRKREQFGSKEGPRTSDARRLPAEGPRLSDARQVPLRGPRQSEARSSGVPLQGPKPSEARRLPAEGPRLAESTERVPGPKYDLVRNQKRLDQLLKQEKEWERKFNERDFEPKPKQDPYQYNPTVRKAEDRVRIAEAKFNREMERERPGHQIRNVSGIVKSWLLSSPITQAMNVVGTGSYQSLREAARLPAVIADVAWSGARQIAGQGAQRSITGPSPSAMLDSAVHAFTVGGREFMEIMRHGATREQMERHQYQEIDFGVNTGRKAIDNGVKMVELAHNAIFRLMSASDRVFYQGAYRRNLVDRATVQAKNEGVSNIRERVRELVDNPSEQLMADSVHDAMVSTFNNNNWLSSKVKRARAHVANPKSLMDPKNAERLNAAENLAMDFILPFDRTPTNVVSRIVEASPLGYVKNASQLVAAAMRKSMPVEHQRQMAQTFGNATAGSVLMALGWYLADEAKKIITVEGYDVYLRIPGIPKINLKTASPAGNIVAVGAKLRTAHQSEKPTWGDYAKPVLQEPLNIPILRATSPLTDIARSPGSAAPKVGGRFASMLIPFGGLSRWIATATDREENGQPTKIPWKGEAVPRKAKGFVDAIKVGVPGLRQTVEKDLKRMPKTESTPSQRPRTVNVGKPTIGARP